MWIVEGSMRMTVGGATAELVLDTTIDDHVPSPERDLVLGELGDSLHVER